MTVAPTLFNPTHALHALSLADSVLRGPTGMATLDPSDLNYRPYYNNSEDSTDFHTSKGRNYHQGPEWLWPTGFFLRALLKFDLMRRGETREGREEAVQQVMRRLEGCKRAIESSPWKGLAELTNRNGELCADSVSSQSFSLRGKAEWGGELGRRVGKGTRNGVNCGMDANCFTVSNAGLVGSVYH